MKLVEIKQRMYGDYLCSCGCMTLLSGTCYGVGDEEDINGYDWRMFTEQCWQRISASSSLEEIYDEYYTSPEADEYYDVDKYDDGWDDDSNISCSDCPDDECTGHCFSCAYRSF